MTRIAAGVTLREPTTRATSSSRSSAMVATPTFAFSDTDAYAVTSAPACVSALKSVVLPLLGRPTSPTCIGIARYPSNSKPTRPSRCEPLRVQHAREDQENRAVLRLERERRRRVALAQGLLERVGARRRHEPAQDLPALERDLDADERDLSHRKPPP